MSILFGTAAEYLRTDVSEQCQEHQQIRGANGRVAIEVVYAGPLVAEC